LVVVRGAILEKPAHRQEAAGMLRRLAGGWHQVISAVHLQPAAGVRGRPRHGTRTTQVRFRDLPPGWLQWLLAAQEHQDKAGAYAAQGRAGALITDVRGPYTNVVGLPLDLTAALLARLGYIPSRVKSPRRERRDTPRRS
jgi:septum formation protein